MSLDYESGYRATTPPRQLAPHPELQYLELLSDLLQAPARPDRTGTGTRSLFGRRMEFDLAEGFPLFTTKQLPKKPIVLELLWFLSGSTDAGWLEERGVNIWREWGDPVTRDMGPIYGKQWRSWATPDGRSLDQITGVLHSLKADPHGRRHIVSAWNPADLDAMALPPCHVMFQFYVEADGRLSCQLYQRSADAFLGLPFNVASYALLLSMFSRVLNREPGRLVWVGGDVHLYRNHEEQAVVQMARRPRPFPTLSMTGAPMESLEGWGLHDFRFVAYQPHPHIAAEVSA